MDKADNKKRILIVSHALELGGAERSLIGLLDAIDKEKYHIDLFLLRHEGELLGMLPSHINLLPEIPAYTVLARPMVRILKEGHLLLCAARVYGKLKAAFYDRRHHYRNSDVALEYSHKYTCPLMPEIQPKVVYDTAISFLTPHYFVAKKVHARKKIAWIHTDYTNVAVNVASESAMWGAYDTIMAISDASAQAFRKTFKNLKSNIVVLENILPQRFIKRQAEEKCELNEKSLTLLSIGRFCTAKNFDNVPYICRYLIEMGLDIKWYLIGFGNDEELIRSKIRETKMEEKVIILGKKSNPYPYIEACDLYVQPSRYEGKCVAVKEAQLLGKPVVITNYATSSSQLKDGIDGIIVPLDNKKCAEGIGALLRNPELMQKLSENCSKHDYSNAAEIKKLEQIIDKDYENKNNNVS